MFAGLQTWNKPWKSSSLNFCDAWCRAAFASETAHVEKAAFSLRHPSCKGQSSFILGQGSDGPLIFKPWSRTRPSDPSCQLWSPRPRCNGAKPGFTHVFFSFPQLVAFLWSELSSQWSLNLLLNTYCSQTRCLTCHLNAFLCLPHADYTSDSGESRQVTSDELSSQHTPRTFFSHADVVPTTFVS